MRAEASCFGLTVPRTDGLFFALLPDVQAARQLERVAAQQCIRHRLTGRPLAADRFHVSLIGFGAPELPREMVAAATRAAATIALPPFDVTFERAVSFVDQPSPRVLCGDNPELIVFRRALGRAVERAGLGRVKPRWTPHVTLLYDERGVDEHAIEPIRWTAREFVLLHSLRGEGRYVPLARWALRGALPLAS